MKKNFRTSLTVFLAFLLAVVVYAQKGYVRRTDDSTYWGYVRFHTSIEGQQGLEVWRTKTDKNPRRILIAQVDEYAIAKDTFKVLREFKPFEGGKTYYALVHAKVLVRGRVNLYSIPSPGRAQPTSSAISPVTMSVTITDPNVDGNRIYVLEKPATGFIRGISARKNPMREGLRDFFPDSFITSFEKRGRIRYKVIPAMTEKYSQQ